MEKEHMQNPGVDCPGKTEAVYHTGKVNTTQRQERDFSFDSARGPSPDEYHVLATGYHMKRMETAR